MLVAETVATIRLEHLVGGKGIKTIARELGLSRNTVRKVLRSGQTSFAYEREEQPRPRLGSFVQRLETMLEANAAASKRDRPTLTRIYDLLRREGLRWLLRRRSRRYAGQWVQEKRGSASAGEAFVPLSFAPGDAYQFDWSHEQVELGGAPHKVKVMHLRLCHSRRFRGITARSPRAEGVNLGRRSRVNFERRLTVAGHATTPRRHPKGWTLEPAKAHRSPRRAGAARAGGHAGHSLRHPARLSFT